MRAQLGRPVIYRDPRGEDRAGVIVRVLADGQAELHLYPRLRDHRLGRTATPVPYSATGEPHSWRSLPTEEV